MCAVHGSTLSISRGDNNKKTDKFPENSNWFPFGCMESSLKSKWIFHFHAIKLNIPQKNKISLQFSLCVCVLVCTVHVGKYTLDAYTLDICSFVLCWTFVGGCGRYLWCVSCWWTQRSTDHRNICVPGRTNHYTNSDTQNHPINGESEIWFFFFSSDVACMSFTWKRVYKCMDKSKSCAIVGHLFFLLFLVLRLRHSYLTQCNKTGRKIKNFFEYLFLSVLFFAWNSVIGI